MKMYQPNIYRCSDNCTIKYKLGQVKLTESNTGFRSDLASRFRDKIHIQYDMNESYYW